MTQTSPKTSGAAQVATHVGPSWRLTAPRTTLLCPAPAPTTTSTTKKPGPTRPTWVRSRRALRGHRPRSAWTKRALCDTVERLSLSDQPGDAKRAEILPDLYRHAVTLAEERAQNLPGVTHDELVSAVGERTVIGLAKLDMEAPPAQQAAYLDRLLHHALADACRNLDPLGRGPRALRRRYEAKVEAVTQTCGTLPGTPQLGRILDDVVGAGRPTLRLMVGAGMSPAEAVTRVTRADQENYGGDPAEAVALATARRQIASAIAAHPDPAVRVYLSKVATGLPARRPADFHRRLGHTLPTLIASLVMDDASRTLPTQLADREGVHAKGGAA